MSIVCFYYLWVGTLLDDMIDIMCSTNTISK
jgi:hypothetical protein